MNVLPIKLFSISRSPFALKLVYNFTLLKSKCVPTYVCMSVEEPYVFGTCEYYKNIYLCSFQCHRQWWWKRTTWKQISTTKFYKRLYRNIENSSTVLFKHRQRAIKNYPCVCRANDKNLIYISSECKLHNSRRQTVDDRQATSFDINTYKRCMAKREYGR